MSDEIDWKKNHSKKSLHSTHIITIILILFVIGMKLTWVSIVGSMIILAFLFIIDFWIGLNSLFSNSKIKKHNFVIMNITTHISFILVIWLFYLSGISLYFLLIFGGLTIGIGMVFPFMGRNVPEWIGISKTGIYFTENKKCKVEKRKINKGIVGNIAVTDAKVENFIPWSDIDGIKVEKPDMLFGKSCWIYLRNGVKVPINDLSEEIIKEIKSSYDVIIDEKR